MNMNNLYVGATVEVDKKLPAKSSDWTLKRPSTIGVVQKIYDRFVLLRMIGEKGKHLYLESFMPDDVVRIMK